MEHQPTAERCGDQLAQALTDVVGSLYGLAMPAHEDYYSGFRTSPITDPEELAAVEALRARLATVPEAITA